MRNNSIKDQIDAFLSENERATKSIERLANNYSMSDFVHITPKCADGIRADKTPEGEHFTGCLYDIKRKVLLLNLDSVEDRLMIEYLDFLYELLRCHVVEDKVFYIVAYHYLNLGKQVGFALTADKNCPFSFFGSDELSKRGRHNLEMLQTVYNSEIENVIGYFDEEDLMFYRKMYSDFGYTFHRTRHFSIVAEFVEFDVFGDRLDFERKVKSVIDAFAFRFRAALATHERGLGCYTPIEDISKIIGALESFSADAF